MKRVEPILVIFLTIITFGIYALVWYVTTKDQMNANGAKIPTAWLLIVPIVNFYWMWKFCEGVEIVTSKRMEGVMAFILLFLLGFIGMAIVQSSLNNVSGAPAQSYQAPQQSYQAPPTSSAAPPTYSAPPPPPPGGSSAPPPPPPPAPR
jgi:hypothetical protein